MSPKRISRGDDRWERTHGGLFLPKRPTLPTRRFLTPLGTFQDCCTATLPVTCCACNSMPDSDITVSLDSAIEFSWSYTCADSNVLSCDGTISGPFLVPQIGASSWGTGVFNFDQTVTSANSCCPTSDTDCCIPQMTLRVDLSFFCPSCAVANSVMWAVSFVVSGAPVAACSAAWTTATHWQIYYRWRTTEAAPAASGSCWELFALDGSHTLPWDAFVDRTATDYGTMTLTTVPTQAVIELA